MKLGFSVIYGINMLWLCCCSQYRTYNREHSKNKIMSICLNEAFETIFAAVCDGPLFKVNYQTSIDTFIDVETRRLYPNLHRIEDYDDDSSFCPSTSMNKKICFNILKNSKMRRKSIMNYIVNDFRLAIDILCRPHQKVKPRLQMYCQGHEYYSKCIENEALAVAYSGSLVEYCSILNNAINCMQKESESFPTLKNVVLNKNLRIILIELASKTQCNVINPCVYNPCYNGGQCEYKLSFGKHQLQCTCPPCYVGEFCQEYSPLYMDVELIEYTQVKSDETSQFYQGIAKQCNFIQYMICMKRSAESLIDEILLELTIGKPHVEKIIMKQIHANICKKIESFKNCLHYFGHACRSTSYSSTFKIIEILMNEITSLCIDDVKFEKLLNIPTCLTGIAVGQNSSNKIQIQKCVVPIVMKMQNLRLGTPTIPYLFNLHEILHNSFTCLRKYLPDCIKESLEGVLDTVVKILHETAPINHVCLDAKRCIIKYDILIYGGSRSPFNPIIKIQNLTYFYEVYEETQDCIYENIHLDQTCNSDEIAEVFSFLWARKISLLSIFQEKSLHPCYKKNPCKKGTCIREKYNKYYCKTGNTNQNNTIFEQNHMFSNCIYQAQAMIDIIIHPICKDGDIEDQSSQFYQCIFLQLPDYCTAAKDFTICLGKDFLNSSCKIKESSMNKVCSIYLKLNTLCHQTCIQNPCKNGGICVNIPSYNLIYTFTYKCICSNEYEGKHCETHNGNMSTIQEDSKHLISKKSHHMFENKTIDFNLQVTLNMEFIIKYYTLNDNETINFIKTLETILSDIHKEEVIVTYLRAGSVIVDYTMKDVLVTGQKIVNYTTTIQNFIKTQKIIVVNGNIVNITDAKLFIQTEDYSINLENTNNLCLLYKITNQCKNNSTCQLTDTMAHCVCFPGYTGEFCDKISTEDFHKNKTHTNSISNRNMFIIFGFVCAAVLLIICIIMICKFKKQANRKSKNRTPLNKL